MFSGLSETVLASVCAAPAAEVEKCSVKGVAALPLCPMVLLKAIVVILFYKKEVKLRDESHLSIALQLRCGTAWSQPHQCDFHTLWWAYLLPLTLAPGTQ